MQGKNSIPITAVREKPKLMVENLSKFGLISFTIFSIVLSLTFLISEIIIGFLANDQIFLNYFIILVIAYAALGLMLGFSTWIIFRLRFRFIQKILNLLRLEHNEIFIIPVSLIFIKGVVIINNLFLGGTKFYSGSSLLIDGVWSILCIFIMFFCTHLVKKELRDIKIKLISGLLISVTGVSLLYNESTRVDEINYVKVLFQIFGLFLICILGFYLGFLISNLTLKFKWIKNFLGRALFISVLFILLFFLVQQIFYDTILLDTFNVDKAFILDSNLPIHSPNIILIVLDTLRADHLSCYGYVRKTSPNLDKLSQQNVQFERCYSTSNWTAPAHASIFTGKFPRSHGLHFTTFDSLQKSKLESDTILNYLNDNELTLAELLREKGYQTAAIISNNANVTKYHGLHQGFNFWYNRRPFVYEPIIHTVFNKFGLLDSVLERFYTWYRIAENINATVSSWVDKHGHKPFFLFINYMDAHDPYFPQSPYDRLFEGKINNFYFTKNVIFDVLKQNITLSKEELEHAVSQYDGEIAYLDYHLGRLFETLKTQGLYDNSIIIITSDHGEYLGEHKLVAHSVELFEPVLKVPLIIKPHQSFSSKLNNENVTEIIDIFPTVLEMVDIQIPDNIQGNSLIRRINHPIVSEYYVPSEYFHERFKRELVSIVKDSYKLILSSDGKNELYKIDDDPGEIHDIIENNSEMAGFLLNEIEKWKSNTKAKEADSKDTFKPDEETLRRLRALGYIK